MCKYVNMTDDVEAAGWLPSAVRNVLDLLPVPLSLKVIRLRARIDRTTSNRSTSGWGRMAACVCV